MLLAKRVHRLVLELTVWSGQRLGPGLLFCWFLHLSPRCAQQGFERLVPGDVLSQDYSLFFLRCAMNRIKDLLFLAVLNYWGYLGTLGPLVQGV